MSIFSLHQSASFVPSLLLLEHKVTRNGMTGRKAARTVKES